MYINVISFKNGLKIPFTTEVPYSVDKVAPGWNLVVDEDNGQTLSFKGEEIVTIASQDLVKFDKPASVEKPAKSKKAHLSIEK